MKFRYSFPIFIVALFAFSLAHAINIKDVTFKIPKFGRVVFDQRLLMRQAHGYLVDAGQSAKRLLDCAGAEGAMETTDPCAYLPAIWSRRRLFTPKLECGSRCR